MRPRGGGGPGRRRRRVVIDSQAARPRPDARQRPGDPPRQREPSQPPAPAPTGPVTIDSGATVKDVSSALGESLQKIMKFLMEAGEMVNITQSLSDEAIELIAAEFAPDRELRIKHADGEDDLEPEVYETIGRSDRASARRDDHGPRRPRQDVAPRCAARIRSRRDRGRRDHAAHRRVPGRPFRPAHPRPAPGHEAFTALRARGAKVTDIAVLVVAADDGVMPQTIESINHAQAAEVPFVVAVNKVDKDGANPQKVRQELVTHELQPEWGGDAQFADVSAKTKQGLDDLLEKILLVADARLELQANAKADASGPIIESRLDVGRGPIATMLVQRGTIRVGDAVVAGDAWGKVKALHDYRGERQGSRARHAGRDLGFDKPPSAGEQGRVVENDRQARHLAQLRGQRVRASSRGAAKGVSLEDFFSQIEAGAVQELNIVVKADVQGSIEAVTGELGKIRHPEVGVNVIHTGIGAISESDVILASASNAIVVGFNVRPNAEARSLAEREGVDIRTYRSSTS